MGQLDGKVAFITGIARGQGRAHAVALAREGADIIGLDLCREIDSTPYPGTTLEDLEETIRLVKETGRQIVAKQADVRDMAQVQEALDSGVQELGRVDIVLANAGICAGGLSWEITEEAWREMIDVNLTGVWHTAKAAIPRMISQGDGGSIVITASIDGIRAAPNISSYAASKFGANGLMESLAAELGPYNIRVNSMNPTCVDTPMIGNEFVWGLFRPDLEHPTKEQVADQFAATHALDVPWIDPEDVSTSIVYLVSDAAKYVTGHKMVMDAGYMVKP